MGNEWGDDPDPKHKGPRYPIYDPNKTPGKQRRGGCPLVMAIRIAVALFVISRIRRK